jgi:hypothetical protein
VTGLGDLTPYVFYNQASKSFTIISNDATLLDDAPHSYCVKGFLTNFLANPAVECGEIFLMNPCANPTSLNVGVS